MRLHKWQQWYPPLLAVILLVLKLKHMPDFLLHGQDCITGILLNSSYLFVWFISDSFSGSSPYKAFLYKGLWTPWLSSGFLEIWYTGTHSSFFSVIDHNHRIYDVIWPRVMQITCRINYRWHTIHLWLELRSRTEVFVIWYAFLPEPSRGRKWKDGFTKTIYCSSISIRIIVRCICQRACWRMRQHIYHRCE